MRKFEDGGHLVFKLPSIFLSLSLVFLFSFPIALEANWPMHGRDCRRTGYSPYPGPVTSRLLWCYEFHYQSMVGEHNVLLQDNACPVIGPDGVIYQITNDGLFAINPDGTLKWKTGYLFWESGSSFGKLAPALSLDGKRIYTPTLFTSLSEGVLALDTVDGHVIWEFEFEGDQTYSSLAVDSDGIIYIATVLPASVYALRPDKTVKWLYTYPDSEHIGIEAPPAIGPDGSVYCIVNTVGLVALSSDGKFKWSNGDNVGSWYGWPTPSVLKDGAVIIAGEAYASGVIAYNPDGTKKWERLDLGRPPGYLPGVAVSADEKTIYTAREGATMYALNADTGATKWSSDITSGEPLDGSPAVSSNGVIYMMGDSGNLYAMSELDGSLLWQYKLNTHAFYWGPQSPALSQDGTLYVVSSGTTAYEGNLPARLYAFKDEPGLKLLSPNGGETWQVGTTQEIKWLTAGAIPKVAIEFSIDNGSHWESVSSSSANKESYSWVIPDRESNQCRVRIQDATDPQLSDTSDSTFSIVAYIPIPEICLSRSSLRFGAVQSSAIHTNSQTLYVQNSGEGNLNWVVQSDKEWLTCTPSSGFNSGAVTVSVDAAGLSAGTYTGPITVSDPNASNSPQTVSVTLIVYGSGQTAEPFGQYATPTDGSTVSSSIPVTGWTLDDIGVESVKIYRGNTGSLVYIGDAVFVEGARPDIEQAYPDYPMNYKAGWGYMMLTNFLPNEGNGTFKIHAIAMDVEGNTTSLGTKTITVDNANAVKPFGAIDTPAQGGTATGSAYRNQGWVLTPIPNSIPSDGSTINVYVDSVNLGHPTYNIYRADIAGFFPGYANSNGAHAYFDFDTTAYTNGVHTIYWIATDSGGNADGIGSRYYTIQNSGSSRSGSKIAGNNHRKPIIKFEELSNLPFNYFKSIKIKKGYWRNIQSKIIQSDEKNIVKIEIRELERMELIISNVEAGYMLAGNKIHPLPVGSTLDTQNGIFSWIPGPGFFGNYRMVFVVKGQNGDLSKQEILVSIIPKFGIMR